MARAGALDLLRGERQAALGDFDLEVAVRGQANPFFEVVGIGRLRLEALAERREPGGGLADQQLELPFAQFHVVLRQDLGGAREIEARLRFLGVDDSRGPHLEVALGLLELLTDRLQLVLGERHRVLREQHVEVGLRDTQNQVLRRLREHHVRLRDLGLGLLEDLEILRPVERLRERDARRVGIEAVVVPGNGRIPERDLPVV